MEAAHSSRSSSTERDEVEVEATISSDLPSSAKGESSVHHPPASPPSETLELEGGVIGRAADKEMGIKLGRKVLESGLGDLRVPDLHGMSGCLDPDATGTNDNPDLDDDDDLCSTSSDDNEESSYNPLASGVLPPVLPDIRLRVPMEDENDVQRVRNALLIKGVLEVSCDVERQVVTVTGIVPARRLLKKVRKVERQAQILSTVSPFAAFINPHFGAPAFAMQEDSDGAPHSNAIDIPAPHPVPNFVVHQQRPRPAFQRYTFHNDPHSPYLRTFSPSDLSPKSSSSSPSLAASDPFDRYRRRGYPFPEDDQFQDMNEAMLI